MRCVDALHPAFAQYDNHFQALLFHLLWLRAYLASFYPKLPFHWGPEKFEYFKYGNNSNKLNSATLPAIEQDHKLNNATLPAIEQDRAASEQTRGNP